MIRVPPGSAANFHTEGEPVPERARDAVRILILVILAGSPLAFGSVQPWAYILLLSGASAAGLSSWARTRRARAEGARMPALPGRHLLLALHVLVLIQLLPLPPGLLKMVSPGSFSFYNDTALLPLREWRPITVSPPHTARGLLFLVGMSLLYAAVFREFQRRRCRRRLAGTVVATALVVTLVALVQAASGQSKLYGIWQPRHDWAVFGPYVNRNHFAGYVVMAIPLCLALGIDAFQGLRRAWGRRHARWRALGGPDGSAVLWRGAVAMGLVAGLLASRSRGGLMAFVVSAAVFALAFRRRRQAMLVIAGLALLGVAWVGLEGIVRGFESRGVHASRLQLWSDTLPLVGRFPALGAGFNAFAIAYPSYQTVMRSVWFGEAHNEYLQVLLETGLIGAGVVAALLVRLIGRAIRAASRSALDAGILAGLLATCFHNLVDFNWQIPANAATFAALAALAVQEERPRGEAP